MSGMKEKKIEYYLNEKTCDRKTEVIKLLTKEDSDIKTTPVKVCRQNNLVFAAVRCVNKKTKKEEVVCKIVNTKTNLRYNDIFRYQIYDEFNCPEEFQTCPSSILKLLTKTDNDKAKLWRMGCKDQLDTLAAEKLNKGTLTNLPVGTEIRLINKTNEDGSEIILEKVSDYLYKSPYWQDVETFQKYKKSDIQSYGFTVLDN